MGAFHEGHLSMMRRARAESDEVVVSLFVNPAQFNDATDLAAYPRDEQRDERLAAELGVDYLFAPPPDEVYPPGFATTVSVAGITETLEGEHRGREHFDGVATVVTKLFNMVQPDIAYFGQKDAQQAVVIRRLVRDLDIPVRIEVCPDDPRGRTGWRMSSRNARLSPDERVRAAALHRGARARSQDAVDTGERDPESPRATAPVAELTASPRSSPTTSSWCRPTPWRRWDASTAMCSPLVAARVGATRLIDNQPLSTAHRAAGSTNHGRP